MTVPVAPRAGLWGRRPCCRWLTTRTPARVGWLDPDRRVVAGPRTADGRTLPAAAPPIPQPTGDAPADVVATLLPGRPS